MGYDTLVELEVASTMYATKWSMRLLSIQTLVWIAAKVTIAV